MKTFIFGKNPEYKDSNIVMLPVGFEKTTTYKKGTSKGPEAILEASKNLELYDEELKLTPKLSIFTDEIKIKDNQEDMVNEIENKSVKYLKDNKFVLMLGGEHTISLGLVKALKNKYKDFTVLQLDAHSDLRNDYDFEKLHHATVMRRVHELKIPIVQVGIRSLSEEEALFIKKEKINTFYANDFNIKKIISSIKTKNVYITIDLDVLDPSIMPSVGTPEPNGLNWNQITSLLKEISKSKNIISADIVELSPIENLEHPNFTAAKLAYKLLGYKFYKNNITETFGTLKRKMSGQNFKNMVRKGW